MKLRTITLMGEITEESVAETLKSIREYTDEDIRGFYDFENKKLNKEAHPEAVYHLEPIYLTISTYGGEVFPSLALYDEIKNSLTPIITIASGYCMSAGLIILLGGIERYATPNTLFMYHAHSSGLYGTVEHLRNHVENFDGRLSKMLQRIILENSSLTRKKLRKLNRRQKDWFFDTAEAIKYNIISDISDNSDTD